jgi:hypothetical protein
MGISARKATPTQRAPIKWKDTRKRQPGPTLWEDVNGTKNGKHVNKMVDR